MWFSHKNDVQFVFTSSWGIMSYLCYLCLFAYSAAIFFLSSSCVLCIQHCKFPWIAHFFIGPLVFSKVYLCCLIVSFVYSIVSDSCKSLDVIGYSSLWHMQEEFEDTKWLIRICISKKNRQHNGQKKINKRTNNDLQNIHIKPIYARYYNLMQERKVLSLS